MSIENSLDRIAAALERIAGDTNAAPTEAQPPKASAATLTSAKPAKSSAPAKTATPPKSKAPAPGSDTTDSDGPTQDQIGNLVEKLIGANLRKETVALMVKIGGKDAKSVTSLMASGGDLALFVEEAEALLMAA
jgi:hypothetical protein